MELQPLVSIMMPAYNAESYIGQAIESGLSQTYPHWELVIVNDGSTDRTAEVIARYDDPRIRPFHQPNAGEAAARNTALRHMAGEYLAFLDADDLFLPDHLERTVRYLQDHPERDGVYTDGYYCDLEGNRQKPLSSRRRGPFEGDIFESVIRSSDVFGAPLCVVLRREVVTKNGLAFDPEIVIGPDWDFLAAFAQISMFGYLPDRTCVYRVHGTNISLQTTSQRRRLYLARCREKAIEMRRFGECPSETREFIFYDLLMNLLAGLPERQADAFQRSEFLALPQAVRARLLRLAAAQALLRKEETPLARSWLRMARRANPADARALALSLMLGASPALCRALMQWKNGRRPDVEGTPALFGELG